MLLSFNCCDRISLPSLQILAFADEGGWGAGAEAHGGVAFAALCCGLRAVLKSTPRSETFLLIAPLNVYFEQNKPLICVLIHICI